MVMNTYQNMLNKGVSGQSTWRVSANKIICAETFPAKMGREGTNNSTSLLRTEPREHVFPSVLAL